MEKQIIWRGLLSGAAAGVLAFVFARVFLEPVIGRAIDYEDGRSDAEAALAVHEAAHEHGAHEHGVELFTRGVQANVGMGFGVLAFSVAMGALFAVAFAVVHGRMRTTRVRGLALVMAASAFVVVYLVPFLKYPANPPSVGESDTIGRRTGLYLLMVVLSLLFAAAGVWLARVARPRLGTWNATLCGLGAYAAAVGVAMLVLPTVSEIPGPLSDDAGVLVFPGFAADDLFEFRLYAVGTQLVIWLTIGLLGGALLDRLLNSDRERIAA
ncbi:MAG: CbtA family protein [Mycobacterium sp.]